jgi:hypothetical protein
MIQTIAPAGQPRYLGSELLEPLVSGAVVDSETTRSQREMQQQQQLKAATKRFHKPAADLERAAG